ETQDDKNLIMGRNCSKIGWLIGLYFGVLSLVVAQSNDQVSFTAFCDAKDVVLNGFFNVSFTLKNANGGSFSPPRFDNFYVIDGPNKMMSSTSINGRRSQEISYSYQLQAKKAGTFVIEAAQITVKGQRMSTKPITIRVQQGKASNDGTDEVFLQARLSSNIGGEEVRDVYLGQQLVLDYVLYSRVDVQGLTAASESTYDGLFMREIHQYDTRITQEVVKGVQYASRILKRIVLYPQRSGTIEIEPLSIIAGIPVKGQRSGGFFSRQQLRRVPATTESISINVKPLPTPQPNNFSDITGNFTISGQLSSNSITTDDALSLKLVFEGQGDLKRVQAPPLSFPDEFELYDPKVIREQYIDLASDIKGRKIFEYLLVPKEAGQYSLSPEVVIFNPDSVAYQTLRLNPVRLEVRQGTGAKKSGLVAEAAQNKGLYKARAPKRLNAPAQSFYGSPVFWGICLFPLVMLGGLFVRQRIEDNKPALDPIMLQKQRARQQALDRLKVAEQHRQANQPRSFYEEVERGLLGYIGDKLQIPRADMTKTKVETQLAALGASEPQRALFQQLIRNCEMALYAGMDNADAMEETYNKALSLLAEMEEVL
ncbi:MAG: BatD family protein, partial [Bacteroidota bacterium]